MNFGILGAFNIWSPVLNKYIFAALYVNAALVHPWRQEPSSYDNKQTLDSTGALKQFMSSFTCCIRLAVVLPTVLQLDGWQANWFHHFMSPFTPVRGAESRHRHGQGQRGETQRKQGAVSSGHFLQHCFCWTWPKPVENCSRWRGEAWALLWMP